VVPGRQIHQCRSTLFNYDQKRSLRRLTRRKTGDRTDSEGGTASHSPES
jgi:hypothetical protein